MDTCNGTGHRLLIAGTRDLAVSDVAGRKFRTYDPRGPLDAPMNDPAYLAPYTDIYEGKEERYESDESYYGVGATFRG